MTASLSLLGLPDRLADGRLPRAVIFAAAHGSTYPGKDSSGYALAADAIRAASQDDAGLVEHWDFDLGGPLFDGKPVSCIDAGDIPTTLHDNAGNRARIEAKTRDVLSMPAVPILVGGDCSVTIPFLAGFADHGPVWILQIDAHIDWRDEVHGERHGYSSPMRRASEMPHVAGMVQVGLRSVGSARLADIEAARAYGSRFVTARGFMPRARSSSSAYSGRSAGRRHPRLRQPRSQHHAGRGGAYARRPHLHRGDRPDRRPWQAGQNRRI